MKSSVYLDALERTNVVPKKYKIDFANPINFSWFSKLTLSLFQDLLLDGKFLLWYVFILCLRMQCRIEKFCSNTSYNIV